ncbi:hypothetical protein TRIP_D50059 [uncultured Paludibacter sp.]|nr:hypothetical protein TRIP_D50059 [uncultured Paludibacter sp.]
MKKEIQNKKIDRFIDKSGLTVAIILSIVGLFVIILFAFISPFNKYGNTNAELFSQYGDFIGGFAGSLFSLAGFFLLYKTLVLQKQTLTEQRKSYDAEKQSFEIERFESTFFNLINYQKDITKNLIYKADSSMSFSGKEIISPILREFKSIWDSLNYQIYCDYKNQDYIMSLYDDDNQQDSIYKERHYSKINEKYKITKEDWKNISDQSIKHRIEDKLVLVSRRFYENFDIVLGEYLRHLFLIIEFISKKRNTNKRFDYDFYIQILKQQFSSEELVLIFYTTFINDKYNILNNKYYLFSEFKKDYIKQKYLFDISHKNLIKINENSEDELRNNIRFRMVSDSEKDDSLMFSYE